MFERVKLTILLLSTLVVGYGLIGGLLERVSAGDESYGQLEIFTRVLDRVERDYVEEPNMEKALKGALHGMIEALDPFSSFVDSKTFSELSSKKDTASPGITLSKRYGYAYVVSVAEGSPADLSGLRTGDLIESIGGSPTNLMSLWESERRLQGASESEVSMRVIRFRRSEPQDVVLRREPALHHAVSARILDNKVGVVRIPDLNSGVVQEVSAKLKMLLSSDVSSLLLDLRDSAEGSLEEAVALSDLFLAEGKTVVSIQGTGGEAREYSSKNDPLIRGIPIVALVDGGTSGPAEVFVGALHDHGLARVIGERTNGHGSIQNEFYLENGSLLLITTKLLVRPNGDRIQSEELRKTGIEPDRTSPSRDFISSFYFENSSDDPEGELSDEFYRRLDSAIEQQQFETALSELQQMLEAAKGESEEAA